MPARLIALSAGAHLLLDKPVLLLGRSAECDVHLPSDKVSRRHCVLADLGPCLAVRDLGSTNGTRINGALVGQGRLRAGDELAVGDLRYRVGTDVAQAPGPNPAPPQERLRTVLKESAPLVLPEPIALLPLSGVGPPPS